jgi:PAS domain S-box-containing protein
MKAKLPQSLLLVTVVAAIYFCAAKLGLTLAFRHTNVSPVWPPSGIALAAVLWYRYRGAIGVLIGAFLINVATGLSATLAAGIGIGNTLEAITAAFLIHRFFRSDKVFDRARDVVEFVVLVPIISTTVSATIGNLSLCLGGASTWENFGSLWLTWWLGDGVSALVVAPLLLSFGEFRTQHWPLQRWAEAGLLLVSLSCVGRIVFSGLFHRAYPNYPLAHLVIPFLLWAAFRFGTGGAAIATVVLSGIATWGTTRGFGPFVEPDRNESLVLLQVFIAAVAITALVLAAIVAEHKNAERRISFLASIVESTDDAVIGKTLDGTIVSWNKGAERIYGYTPDEVIGRSISILIPADRVDELARVSRRPVKGGPVERYDAQRLRKDGQRIDVSLTISPIKDSSGDVSGTSSVARDVTERRLADDEREKLLVQERKARQEAEIANRLKEEFLGIISHELRTPLNTILGWTNLLRRGALDPECAARALESVERSARQQSRMIEDLLDISRIIGGRAKLDVRPVELGSVVSAAVAAIAPSAADKHIEIAVGIVEGRTLITGDSHRMEQVLSNLLSNAIKFTPAGGRIDVRLSRLDSLAEVTVSDNGEGIDPEFLPYVFDRFRQGDSSYTRRHSGLGIGLSIVRYLVESHHGTVAAMSAGAGHGATFKVTLPLAEQDTDEWHPAVAPHPPLQPVELEGVRVLVVDDDPDTLELIKVTLQFGGAAVKTAPSARQALDLMKEWIPEVLVSDIGMPDQNGYSLIRTIRMEEKAQAVAALALTGYAGLEDAERARQAGYQMHLAKPITPETLVEAVATLARNTSRARRHTTSKP